MMKHILQILGGAAFTVGLIISAGCGGAAKEDPDAAKNAKEEEVLPEPDPEAGLDTKGEKSFKPKKKKDDLPSGGDGEDSPEG